MQKVVEDAINLLITALNKHFDDFHGLYLHGIFTDGKQHKDKDIELVAIFDCEDRFKREIIWPIVGKIETELGVFIDFHPITMSELEKDEEFYDDVVNQGVFFDVKGRIQAK
jgi:predicted nucleotidyltransferase